MQHFQSENTFLQLLPRDIKQMLLKLIKPQFRCKGCDAKMWTQGEGILNCSKCECELDDGLCDDCANPEYKICWDCCSGSGEYDYVYDDSWEDDEWLAQFAAEFYHYLIKHRAFRCFSQMSELKRQADAPAEGDQAKHAKTADVCPGCDKQAVL